MDVGGLFGVLGKPLRGVEFAPRFGGLGPVFKAEVEKPRHVSSECVYMYDYVNI